MNILKGIAVNHIEKRQIKFLSSFCSEILKECNFNYFILRGQSIFPLQPDELQPTEAPMKPSEEEEFKEKSNEEKMEKEMKNNDEEID